MNMNDPQIAAMYAQYLAGGIPRELTQQQPRGPTIDMPSSIMPEGGAIYGEMGGDLGALFRGEEQAAPGMNTGTPLEFSPGMMPPPQQAQPAPTPNPHPDVFPDPAAPWQPPQPVTAGPIPGDIEGFDPERLEALLVMLGGV